MQLLKQENLLQHHYVNCFVFFYRIVTRLELFIQPPLSQADRDVGRFIEPNQKARANVTFLLEPMTESEFKGCGRCATNDGETIVLHCSSLRPNLSLQIS